MTSSRGALKSFFVPSSRLSLYLNLALRALQLGATTLTTCYFCSLIGFHRAHYCSARFYKDECAPYQQEHARVPTLYIVFVTLCCLVIIGVFVLGYRQITWFLSFESPDDTKAAPSPKTDWEVVRSVVRSVPKVALIFDSAVLVTLLLSVNEYWISIIDRFHMHPGSGYARPVCFLFEHIRTVDDMWWKNLRIEYQRCMDNQISFYGAIGVTVFTALLVIVDGCSLHFERAANRGPHGILDGAVDKPPVQHTVPVDANTQLIDVDPN